MYSVVKKLLLALFPKKILIKHEEKIRALFSVFYRGKKQKCTVCNTGLQNFIKIETDVLCPACGSLSRDRRLWVLLQEHLKPSDRVLDFSPSRPLARRLKKKKDIHYIATDLSGNFIADEQFDITNIGLEDNAIDFVVCYHVLEHIEDDRKAMQELYRVLKTGGKALIQTPFKSGAIHENPLITTPGERLKHFGQDDHVRVYSVEGLTERLEHAGFTANKLIFEKDNYYGLSDETVLFLTKP